MKNLLQISFATLGLVTTAQGFVAPSGTNVAASRLSVSTLEEEPATTTTTSSSSSASTGDVSKNPLFEYLKFDKEPTFDVLAKTIAYTESQSMEGEMDESLYAEDYVLRGPVIGPIVRKDLQGSQNGLGIKAAFPNTKISSFGHTIDPENPYRCFYFQRWRATFEADLDAYGDIYPATGQEAEMPVATFTVVWNPEGKIIYEQVGAVVDRLEGNTAGKAAIFGLLHAAGLKIPAKPGDGVFAFVQRLAHVLGGRGRSWSRKKDIPEWWTSTSKGADETEQL